MLTQLERKGDEFWWLVLKSRCFPETGCVSLGSGQRLRSVVSESARRGDHKSSGARGTSPQGGETEQRPWRVSVPAPCTPHPQEPALSPHTPLSILRALGCGSEH